MKKEILKYSKKSKKGIRGGNPMNCERCGIEIVNVRFLRTSTNVERNPPTYYFCNLMCKKEWIKHGRSKDYSKNINKSKKQGNMVNGDKNPDLKNKRNLSLSEIMKKKWQDPDYREMMSKAMLKAKKEK